MKIYNNLKIIFFFSLSIIFFLILSRIFGNYSYKFDLLNLGLSTSFLIICILYIFLFLKKNKKKNYFPFFPLVILYFVICYGLSFEFLNSFFLEKHQKNISKVYFLLIVGLFFLGLGYFTFKKILSHRKEIKFLEFNNYNHLLILSFILIVINIANKFINFIPSSLNQIVIPTISISCSIIFYYLIAENKKKKYFFLLPLFIIILLEVLKSSYVFPAILLLQYLVIYFIIKRKIPIFLILIFFIFFIVLHSHKNDFRNHLTKNNITNLSNATKIFYEIYSKRLHNFKETQYFNLDDNHNYQRIAHSFMSLYIIVDKTPNNIPYWKGETYKIIYSKFIPRIFWPNKPSDNTGNIAGKRYEMIPVSDFHTSWNFPILNESYANYGFMGVIIVTFFLGILVRLLTNLFSVNNFNNLESHIGIYICCTTFFWEPHLSLVYGGLYFPIIFLYILSSFYKYLIIYLKAK